MYGRRVYVTRWCPVCNLPPCYWNASCPLPAACTCRTFNRDYDRPNHNADHLAPLLRDSLMPARGRMHRDKSAFLAWKTSLFDVPLLGLPGIVNFIDVRTQWFDAAVKGAIRDGITQVCVCVSGGGGCPAL
jgi:hypothetical protein